MINANVSELLGFGCHYLNEEGTVAAIETPFLFGDGDPIPVYIEQRGDKLRFFDDGGVVWHFMSLGVPVYEPGQADFIKKLAAPSGVALNNEEELEIWSDIEHAPAAFARFMGAMFAMVRWEQEEQERADKRWRQEKTAGANADSDSPTPLSA